MRARILLLEIDVAYNFWLSRWCSVMSSFEFRIQHHFKETWQLVVVDSDVADMPGHTLLGWFCFAFCMVFVIRLLWNLLASYCSYSDV